MWVSAFFGMVTKYAEAVLAVRFRGKDRNGMPQAGPMYIIREGLGKGWHWLGGIYCFFGCFAAFGMGNATQVNAVITGINSAIVSFGGRESRTLNIVLGLILAILVGLMLLGGARRIGSAAELLVPFASVCYLLLCPGILIFRADAIPGAFGAIFRGAFSPGAVTGGVPGSAFQSLRVGVSRGVFTYEAGMGTAAIAHASARVDHPAEQGLMGIVEVFLDTIVICTMTALGILCSGVPIPYGQDTGAELTVQAFSDVYGNWVSLVIAASLCCFAFATILGWGLYGLRCAQFLFGPKAWKLFAAGQTVMVLIGAVLQTGTVWLLAEIVNGLMAIPNIIALIWLMPVFILEIKAYKKAYR
jgi:AGCS family alanine or glycine:cation symporter